VDSADGHYVFRYDGPNSRHHRSWSSVADDKARLQAAGETGGHPFGPWQVAPEHSEVSFICDLVAVCIMHSTPMVFPGPAPTKTISAAS
jgi:hypothetical protein